MKKKQRAALIFGVLIVGTLILLGSCGGRGNGVSLFIYREDDLFMRGLTEDIQIHSEGKLDLETRYGRNSQAIQNEQIESALEADSSVMLINPVDRLGAHAISKRLKAADVPVIYFNREPLKQDLELWRNAWYVGALAEQSGRMQAALAMELFGPDPAALNAFDRNGDGKIQTVIIKGEQGHQDAEIRTASVQAAFQESGYELDILATEIANWNRNEAYDRMGDLLEDLSAPMELVLSNNDAMALGAISVMRQRGYFQDASGDGRVGKEDSDWLPVLGIDGVPDAVTQIEEGYLYGTVVNDAGGMAEAIVDLAVRMTDESFESPENVEDRYIWIDYQTFRLD